jgi:hypothetical protein
MSKARPKPMAWRTACSSCESEGSWRATPDRSSAYPTGGAESRVSDENRVPKWSIAMRMPAARSNRRAGAQAEESPASAPSVSRHHPEVRIAGDVGDGLENLRGDIASPEVRRRAVDGDSYRGETLGDARGHADQAHRTANPDRQVTELCGRSAVRCRRSSPSSSSAVLPCTSWRAAQAHLGNLTGCVSILIRSPGSLPMLRAPDCVSSRVWRCWSCGLTRRPQAAEACMSSCR